MMGGVSDHERELRDRLEAAQSELKRANQRLDVLEGVAADRDVLRSQLEVAQADLKAANERLAELEAQSTEALEAELDDVTRDRDLLRQRLEQADKTREVWDHKVAQREAELAAVREELAATKAPAPPKPPERSPWWLAAPLTASALGGIAVLLLRSC